jgi:threonine dehydrogenase-like Zn-dependent dehydrogenase
MNSALRRLNSHALAAPRSAAPRGGFDVPKIVDWYMDRKVNIDDLITHVMPLEKINDAFDLMHRGESDSLGGYFLKGRCAGHAHALCH